MASPRQNNCIVPLNLPPRRLQLGRDSRGRTTVYDPLRRKSVVLTPEEWVRQHFVAHLVADLGYPPPLLANEVGIRLNGLQRRCDTVVWDAATATPQIIVEYKAPDVEITGAVFDQIVRYNMVLRARLLIVSNGMSHYCCRIDYAANSYSFLPSIPAYGSL